MLLARASAAQTVLLSPLIFGLSHAHHFYEFRLTHPRVPVAGALLRTALQLAYTTLFGAYATLVYVRSGSLLAVCAVHAFCNAMGLPQLWGRVRPPPAAARIGPVMAVEGTDPAKATAEGAEEAEEAAGEGGGAGWTVAYYTLLVAGAALWWRNLWALTESDSALMPASAFSRS